MICEKCGAIKCELGQEPTPALFVAHLVEIFREVRRVLRDDGTCWVNIGDSYASTGGHTTQGETSQRQGRANVAAQHAVKGSIPPGLKSKDLMLMPYRLAIALQDDGWYVRSAIVWAKKACMPESVTDRPTSAHEMIWLLTKAPRYFYDAEAVKEESLNEGRVVKAYGEGAKNGTGATGVNDRRTAAGFTKHDTVINGRNQRNVWWLGPEPYAEAHFACVDDTTECLTLGGWKRHDDLRPGEMIAGYNLDDQQLRWRPLEAVARYAVEDQPLVYAKASSLDMALTPNHRCVIQRRALAGGYSAPKIKRADELRFADVIPTTATWDEAGEPFDERWAELLGWYVAEGHESKMSLAVEIYQSLDANAQNVDRLRELLYAVGAEWSEATGARTWRGRDTTQTAFRVMGYAAARLRELAPGKALQTFVLAWSDAALRALMRGLVGGDGHTRTDGRISFIQKAKATADLVQAISIRLGWSAVVSQRPSDGIWVVYLTKHTRRSLRGTAGKGADIEARPYTGVVWCPKTIDGTWVARRNGRVFITGNTFPTEIPRRAILAGTSQKGVCAACGAPWKRIVDRVSNWAERKAAGGTADNVGVSATYQNGVHGSRVDHDLNPISVETRGWQPGCACEVGEPIGALVLDPFSGSGTSGMVALRHGRRYIGLELNESYVALSERRIVGDSPLFNATEVSV